jgi:hypothetical protein
MVNIELDDEEAEVFKEFRKYQGIWEQIFSKSNKNTEITLFFNGDSELKIAKEIKTYGNNRDK